MPNDLEDWLRSFTHLLDKVSSTDASKNTFYDLPNQNDLSWHTKQTVWLTEKRDALRRAKSGVLGPRFDTQEMRVARDCVTGRKLPDREVRSLVLGCYNLSRRSLGLFRLLPIFA